MGVWGHIEIPHIGVTGPHGSGKTLFGLSIDPEHTLNIDLEDSSATFASTIPVKKRVSMYRELGAKFPGKIPTSLQSFHWFREYIESVKPGEYSVLFVDPINDIEAGIFDWVTQCPAEFGLSQNQVAGKSSGAVWGAVNRWWKMWIGFQSSKFETFVFSTHLGLEWGSDGKPKKGVYKAKGKSVLSEIASLYMVLNRPDQDGIPREEPVGIVHGRIGKQRLAVWDPKTRKIVSAIPPRIDPCTPDKIREYIKDPVGIRQLREEEKLPAETEAQLTEDERLELKAQIAENEMQAETLRSMRVDSIQRRAAQEQEKKAAEVEESHAKDKEILQDIQDAGDRDEKSKLVDLINHTIRELGWGLNEIETICSKRNVASFAEMNVEQLEEIRGKLQAELNAKN